MSAERVEGDDGWITGDEGQVGELMIGTLSVDLKIVGWSDEGWRDDVGWLDVEGEGEKTLVVREEEDEGAGIKSLNFCSKVESRCLKRFLSLFKQILKAVERVSEENLARDGCRVEIVES